ncbi:MAG: response regulator, partial [Gammaproteobacteria bacterium]|nr:response regulator [Gammaproteobacteria bacterium]
MDSQSIAHVHIVDDDASVRESLEFLIKSLGWKAYTYKSAKDFLEGYSACGKDCLLLDVHLPDMSGLELQEIVNSQDLDVSTILMTGYGDVPTAVKAMKLGAVDFLEKPVDQQA